MNRSEFDDLAVRALHGSGEASEKVWKAAKPRQSWLPTWSELGLATAAGGVALMVISMQRPTVVPAATEGIVVRKKAPVKPFDDSLLSVNRLAGVDSGMMERLGE
ncbi:MAG: hypothetical protein ACAH95_06350 [Fimbriimonas sp.]